MGRDLRELKPPGRWVGRRLDVHDCVDSTNLIAEDLARAGAPEGTLVISDRQTAGRGRLGRSFHSPGGRSLYLSLLLRPACRPEELHRAVFVAAVAVAETARARLPADVAVEIKWPNDVLLGGRKTSGINLPAHVDASGVHWAVLGIGLNVNATLEDFPPELHEIATSLRMAGGRELDRVEVAEELLGRLEAGLDLLAGSGFEQVLDRWRNFFRMRGDRVRVGGPGVPREIEGTVTGVGPDGALLLDTGAGTDRILAGDVTVLARSSPEET
jgi:BirA family biotin operon repressor/biotin-[acetyl-CoA-carboxylase] ligase